MSDAILGADGRPVRDPADVFAERLNAQASLIQRLWHMLETERQRVDAVVNSGAGDNLRATLRAIDEQRSEAWRLRSLPRAAVLRDEADNDHSPFGEPYVGVVVEEHADHAVATIVVAIDALAALRKLDGQQYRAEGAGKGELVRDMAQRAVTEYLDAAQAGEDADA